MNYYATLLHMADCAISDRLALLDAYRTDHVLFYEQGSRSPDAICAYETFKEIESTVTEEIARFKEIKKRAEKRLKHGG